MTGAKEKKKRMAVVLERIKGSIDYIRGDCDDKIIDIVTNRDKKKK